MKPNKSKMKEFLRAMGRMQEEDYVTSEEFYKIFNTLIETVKSASVNNTGKIAEINKAADKKAKELERYFADLLKAVDKRMAKVENGKPGKDGRTPTPGIDYPDYQEIRDFVIEEVGKLPKTESATETITVDYIKDQLMALEGNDRLPYTAISGIETFIDETMRKLGSELRRGPMAITGGGTGSGSGGATTFLGLTDTPSSYTANQYVKVNATGDALELVTLSGGGDMTAAVYDPATKAEQILTVSDISDIAYNATTWDGVTNVAPSKNAVRDQFEALSSFYQPLDAQLTSIAGLTPASSLLIGNGLGGYEMVTPANFITNNNILDTADIGVNVQAYDADLSTIAAANNGAVLAATTASFLIADESKLDGIEAGADVTDETNVVSALSGATLTGVTVTGTDKILIQDTSDSDNLKTVDPDDILALLNSADTVTAGLVELATGAEAVTGTDTSRAVTPDALTDRMAAPGTIGGTTPGAGNFSGITMTGNVVMGDQDITGAGSISFTQELDNGSKTASFSVDFSTDNHQKVTLTANTMTLTLDTTNIGVGVNTLKIVNGGLATLTWAAETGSVLWAGGSAPTLTSSGTDIISIYFDGTNFYGVPSLAFA